MKVNATLYIIANYDLTDGDSKYIHKLQAGPNFTKIVYWTNFQKKQWIDFFSLMFHQP